MYCGGTFVYEQEKEKWEVGEYITRIFNNKNYACPGNCAVADSRTEGKCENCGEERIPYVPRSKILKGIPEMSTTTVVGEVTIVIVHN